MPRQQDAMNSKQRVLCAIACEEPDRVPMDFSANPATLARLHQDLGTSSHRGLLDRLHADIVDLLLRRGAKIDEELDGEKK